MSTNDVWPRRLRPAPRSRAARHITQRQHGKCGRTQLFRGFVVADFHLSSHDIDDAFLCGSGIRAASGIGRKVRRDRFLRVLRAHRSGVRISRLKISLRLLLDHIGRNAGGLSKRFRRFA